MIWILNGKKINIAFHFMPYNFYLTTFQITNTETTTQNNTYALLFCFYL